MSHRTTSRRCRTRTACRAILIGSPPVRVACRMVRRMSSRAPSLRGRYRRVRRGGTAITSCRIRVASCASSDGESCAKSRSLSRSVIDATRRTAGRPHRGRLPSPGRPRPRRPPPPPAPHPARAAPPAARRPRPPRVRPVGWASARSADSTTMFACGAVTSGRRGRRPARPEQLAEHPLEYVDLRRSRHHGGERAGVQLRQRRRAHHGQRARAAARCGRVRRAARPIAAPPPATAASAA